MISIDSVVKVFRTEKGNKRSGGGDAPYRREIRAVDGVSVACVPGRIKALLGPNGAGKTTLLRLLATLLRPDQGRIEVNGVDAVEYPIAARGQMGFLTGSSGLYDRLTAREILGFFGRLNGMGESAIRDRTVLLSDRLGLGEFLDRRVARYSTGMKQRVSIARTVIHDPQVIVLDEPTSGLDVLGAKSIIEWMRECRASQKTVLFSTHHMDEVGMLADDLAIIHRGVIRYDGPMEGFRAKHEGKSLEQAFLDEVEEVA